MVLQKYNNIFFLSIFDLLVRINTFYSAQFPPIFVCIFLQKGHVTLMKKYYKNSSTWASYNLPQVLKERGVDDAEKLPNFHYREDAMKHWEAVESFVNEVMSVYYHSDDDIKKVFCG